nr:beta subunit of RNA polymerase [Chlorococcum sp. KSF0227]
MKKFQWKKQVGLKYSSICFAHSKNNNEIPFFKYYINNNNSKDEGVSSKNHTSETNTDKRFPSLLTGAGSEEKAEQGTRRALLPNEERGLLRSFPLVPFPARCSLLLEQSKPLRGEETPALSFPTGKSREGFATLFQKQAPKQKRGFAAVLMEQQTTEQREGMPVRSYGKVSNERKQGNEGKEAEAKNQKEEYLLETFKRSNQDTCLIHKPSVIEGSWVQSGDLLTDCASSVGGELSLGQNLLIAYMPWEGYNFEDAILISERLVMDDLYTSVHIERYELETQQTKLGSEEITRNIPDVSEKELAHLDSFGIIKLGSWVEEGDILVGKITPINKKKISPYQKLLYTILEKQVRPIKDSSLRAPKGIKAKVIDIKYFLKSSNYAGIPFLRSQIRGKKKPASCSSRSKGEKGFCFAKRGTTEQQASNPQGFACSSGKQQAATEQRTAKQIVNSTNENNSQKLSLFLKKINHMLLRCSTFPSFLGSSSLLSGLKNSKLDHKSKNSFHIQFKLLRSSLNCSVPSLGGHLLSSPLKPKKRGAKSFATVFFKENPLLINNQIKKAEIKKTTILKNMETIHIYLAEKRKVQVGDKMAGRHGNKGIVSKILPIQDMPYLPDGTPIDMVLNPLGVPSRMNVGQIYECLLGLAGKFLGENYKVSSFDEIYGPEASRSFVFNKLYEARSKTGLKWLFDPNSPGKIRLYDGRNGECFDQKVTVGQAYMLRLVHMVDDKIHCLAPDHDVLTSDGWIRIADVTLNHKVATLSKTGELIYEKPNNLFHYHNYKGSLYHIKNKNIDLLVTLNHRMYVKKGLLVPAHSSLLVERAEKAKQQQTPLRGEETPALYSPLENSREESNRIHGASFDGYQLIQANDIIGKHCRYLKNANWLKEPYQFILPSIISNSVLIPEKKVNMDAWLLFFGLWVAKGFAVEIKQRAVNNQINKYALSSDINAISSDGVAISLDKAAIPLKLNTFSSDLGTIPSSLGYDYLASSPLSPISPISPLFCLLQSKPLVPFKKKEQEPLVSLLSVRLKKAPYGFCSVPAAKSSKFLSLGERGKERATRTNQTIKEQETISKKDFYLSKSVYQVQVCQHKTCVLTLLKKSVDKLGYSYSIIDSKLTIFNKQLWSYLRPLSVRASNKSLPSWVWQLSQEQARLLLDSMCLGDGIWRGKSVSYYTSSVKLADDVMRLILHAGWSGNKYLHSEAGSKSMIEGRTIISNYDMWRISIIKSKNNPEVNHEHHKEQNSRCFAALFPKGKREQQEEKVLPYEGSVYCLSVPNEVFYVRRNGLPVWTGNSRSTGPYSLVTQQPLRGRSKQGGQRLGEMEVWALEGYGAAFTLLEMLTIKSDDMTGRMTLWSNLILNKDISIGTPESFKVLVCELQALCLDIGLFRYSESNCKNSNLREINNLINLP